MSTLLYWTIGIVATAVLFLLCWGFAALVEFIFPTIIPAEDDQFEGDWRL